jgi:hypothetical protein
MPSHWCSKKWISHIPDLLVNGREKGGRGVRALSRPGNHSPSRLAHTLGILRVIDVDINTISRIISISGTNTMKKFTPVSTLAKDSESLVTRRLKRGVPVHGPFQ